ncbi:hypothetical protein Tco_1149761, partial [Tanacetum coccineum]
MSWNWWFGDGDGGVRLWYGSSGGDEDEEMMTRGYWWPWEWRQRL